MKRKAFPILLCFLICLSLVGVGFAGWVITGSDEEIISDGKITVESVTDNRYAITAVGWDGSSTLNFVGNTTPAVENAWLTYDGAVENLKVTYTFKVQKGGADYKELTGISAKATIGSNLSSAITNNYIAKISDLDNLTVEVDAETGVYSVTLQFAWGTAFGSKNPYAYYNGLEANETNKNNALTVLSSLAALNNEAITITITAKDAE